MSSAGLPKEQLPAYQRWEMASFGKRNSQASVSLTTAEQVERIHLQSREEGYAAGYQEGRAQAAQEVQHLRALLDDAGGALGDLDQTVAEELLALALEVSRRMLGQALKLRPELVLPVIQEAVRCLPQFQQTVRLVLHPQDAALVHSYIAEHPAASSWILVEDAHLERGGCRVETPNGEVDATLQNRWQRVVATLGSTEEWLTP